MKTCAHHDNWEAVQAECRAVLPDNVLEFIDRHRGEPPQRRRLISVLHQVQAHDGYLGEEQLHAVAQLLGIPHAQVTGVATFYHFFRLKPRGRHMINICLGTACYVKGADKLTERFKQELGIAVGETSRDGMFTLEASRCVGTCGLAPVIMIDDQVHGPVTPDDVPAILNKYLKRAHADDDNGNGR